MNVVFFSHYYPPEGNAPASRTAEHCSRWAGRDDVDRVTVITCAPNVPDGRVYSGYRNRLLPQRETLDGVEVVRVWTYIRPDAGRAKLILNYVSFFVSSLLAFLFWVPRPNVIVATTPQFFCGLAGIVAGILKWRPVVLEVRDIWPESIVTVGALRRGLVIRTLEWLERWMYRRADHIVAVGPGYRENILSKVEVGDRISMVTNGVDPERFAPHGSADGFRERYGLSGRFVCSYIGTVGMAHGLEVVVHAAERFKRAGRNDVGFLIVGSGARLEELQRAAEASKVGDLVKFTGRLDKSEIPAALLASDACLVHLSKVDLFQHVIPSKIFETMAMERPIIMGVRGRARDIVLAAGSGLAMEPESDQQLYETVNSMADDAEAVRAMGTAGRAFVVEHFNRDLLANDMLTVLRRTAAGERFCLPDRRWDKASVGPQQDAGPECHSPAVADSTR